MPSALPGSGLGAPEATDMWGRGRNTGAGISGLLLPSCVSSDKLINLSEPPFLTL